jgi:hypothetical protein
LFFFLSGFEIIWFLVLLSDLGLDRENKSEEKNEATRLSNNDFVLKCV